jgi:serine/threonine protein kinase
MSEVSIEEGIGVINYMAPEIVSKIPYVGFPVDIWAAGVVLYAMLSGDFPYKGFYYYHHIIHYYYLFYSYL